MNANCVNFPKGPALLAQSGVTLNDAIWLYRQSAVGQCAGIQRTDPRYQSICRKVRAFVARNCKGSLASA